MAEKWHKNGIESADDMENEICYTDTVYKWVYGACLFFYAMICGKAAGIRLPQNQERSSAL